MYNAPTRHVDAKLEIYFTDIPVTVDKSNYLISFELLEETGSDSEKSLIGDVSANELEIRLLNKDGIFSPYNAESPYYGLMRAGVKVICKMRASVDDEWDEMGVFYVDDWYAEVTGLLASVTCYDSIHSVLRLPAPFLYTTKNVPCSRAFDILLSNAGVAHNILGDVQGTLDWWYSLDTIGATLKELSTACFVASFCDRRGAVKVMSTYAPREATHKLTDHTQIISAVVPQSINRDYYGLNVVLNRVQLSSQANLLDIKEYSVIPGIASSSVLSFSKKPVVHVDSVVLSSNSDKVDLLSFKCTPSDVYVTTRNDDQNAVIASLAIYGKVIETVKSTYSSYGTDVFTFDNVYVQNDAAAELANSILERFITNRLPSLKLNIRGNPKMHIGDKVEVESARYNLSFYGMLKRAKYTYDGSLRCEVELINSSMLEVT